MDQDIETFLPVVISRLRKKITNRFTQELQTCGVTPEQWALLEHLEREPGCSQKELAEALFKDRSNITRILDKLEKQGLLNRSDHTEDRRIYLINLTDSGRKLQPYLRKAANNTQEVMTSGLTDKEFKLFLKLLNKIEILLD